MSKSRVGLLLPLITVLTTLLTLVGSAPHEITARADGVSEVLLSWEWELPAYRLASVVGDDGRRYTRVEAEGLVSGGLPGWPNLPRLGKLVALPPSGDFRVVLTEVSYETVSLDHPVEPAPAPAPIQFDADGLPRPGEWTFALDENAYTGSGPYPAEFATLADPAWMRDQRLARLTITPFRYHPERRALDVARHLRLQVVSVGEGLPSIPPADGISGPRSASAALNSSDVLNPADLDAFRAARPPILQPSAPERSGEFKILVETEGVYALDYTTLSIAGVPLASVNPTTLRLIHGGSEVAVQWEGNGNGIFESGERLVFYARPQLTRYAAYDVYWLTWGAAAGQRMGSRSGNPTGLPVGTAWATTVTEENIEYDSLYAGWDGDHWFWRKLRQPDILTEAFTVTLQTPDPGTGGDLAIWLQGYTRDFTDPDHHVEFAWNGTNLGDVAWEGKIAYTATFGLPVGSLNGGDNTLLLTLPDDLGGDVEGVWVDVVTVTYGLSGVGGNVARFQGENTARAYTVGGFTAGGVRVYDVSDPAAPLVVNGWTEAGGAVSVGDSGSPPAEYLILTGDQIQSPVAVFAAKSYVDPSAGADYIIITHPEFVEALAPLVDHRTSEGLRVAVADVEALYDYFGDGRMAPQAIRDFLGHAYANWPGAAPLYVLLVGDGTYDPRGYWPGSNLTYVPPYLADVDPWMGETSSDKLYAELTGDVLPELRLGRLPVNTPDEVTAVVNKIIAYELTPTPGDWKRRLVFGADNPSTAGNHHDDADKEYEAYASPTSGYEGVRVYFSETAGLPHLYTDATDAQDALVAALNEGALFYTFFGHSSWHQEAVLETDNYAPLFHRDHIDRLANSGRWPMVLHMTCFTGYYIHLTSKTLDESLLRTADVGAVAVWGPSGNGVVADHRLLNEEFYKGVFDEGLREVGAAISYALTGLHARGVAYDLIDTYHLFGDPAMMLDRFSYSMYVPVVMRGF